MTRLLASTSRPSWANQKRSRLLSTNIRLLSIPLAPSSPQLFDSTSNHPLFPRSTLSIADHVGQIQPAIRAYRRRCSQLRNPPVHGTQHSHSHVHIHIYTTSIPPNRPLIQFQLTSHSSQRAASSSSGAESSQWATTATASAATVFAAGSAAWYYYQFGREAHAMTPAEEGYVTQHPYTHSTTQR